MGLLVWNGRQEILREVWATDCADWQVRSSTVPHSYSVGSVCGSSGTSSSTVCQLEVLPAQPAEKAICGGSRE